MNRNDLLPLLASATTREPYRQLREQLREMDEVELFYGLYLIAVQRPHQKPPYPILFAGRLLLELNPECQLSCIEAIRLMLDGWDVSLEEVPFYVFQQFGMTMMQAAIKQLEAEPIPVDQRVYLQTVEYWSRAANSGSIAHVTQW